MLIQDFFLTSFMVLTSLKCLGMKNSSTPCSISRTLEVNSRHSCDSSGRSCWVEFLVASATSGQEIWSCVRPTNMALLLLLRGTGRQHYVSLQVSISFYGIHWLSNHIHHSSNIQGLMDAVHAVLKPIVWLKRGTHSSEDVTHMLP